MVLKPQFHFTVSWNRVFNFIKKKKKKGEYKSIPCYYLRIIIIYGEHRIFLSKVTLLLKVCVLICLRSEKFHSDCIYKPDHRPSTIKDEYILWVITSALYTH